MGYEELYKEAEKYIKELFKDDFGGHGADHSLRVCRNAMAIAEKEQGCDREVVMLAALLHDADDYKLFATENNANARAFLLENGVASDRTEDICRAINSVSFSHNKGKAPDTLEGKIVQDADRLDAIGAVGVARTFAFGGQHGRPLEDSVKHFYDKPLLLKDLMNTDAAKEIAEERHAFLENFLRQIEKELQE
ncbi:MAG: HD domain-containing protein [Firmicutes bacterium]|nr:HD domain-containing protein [Bacillota bacterium]